MTRADFLGEPVTVISLSNHGLCRVQYADGNRDWVWRGELESIESCRPHLATVDGKDVRDTSPCEVQP